MFSGQALKISTLISCLSAAVILDLQTAAAQRVPQPAGDIILHKCEKELARDGLREFIASGLATGGTIAGVSYKAYKLSNTVKQKDVVQFLTKHGLPWNTVRTLAPRIKSIVTGKVFRGGSLAGILVGGAMVVLGWNEHAKASTTVGSSDRTSAPEYSHEDFSSDRTSATEYSDEDLGPRASQPSDKTADAVIIAPPKVQSSKSQRERFEDFDNTIKREFGEKYTLAIWFAANSIAKYNEAGGDDVIIYSRLQTCSDEKEANPERVQSAASALQVCLLKRTMLECLFEQEPVKNTLKNILSQISINNGDISWDARKFEGD
jgi:hypothetical protein